MLEKIIVLFIVGCCIFFIGRRFFRQWQSVIKNNEAPCCSDCCSPCAPHSTCENKK